MGILQSCFVLKRRTSAYIVVTWKDKCHNPGCCPPSSSYSEILLLDMMHTLCKHMRLVLYSYPSCVTFQLRVHPLWGHSMRNRGGPDVVQALFSQQKLKRQCVINTILVTILRHSTICVAMKEMNSVPA